MPLNEKDKERIEQESYKYFTGRGSGISSDYKIFFESAESEALYQQSKSEKLVEALQSLIDAADLYYQNSLIDQMLHRQVEKNLTYEIQKATESITAYNNQ